MDVVADVGALTRVRRLARSGAARAIRAAAGLSLEEVARPVGVAGSTILRWETGTRTPHGSAAIKYLEALDEIASHS
ncbi:MAG: helix-turn-helix transcriptional regulator [Acidimicrobiales bacterium]